MKRKNSIFYQENIELYHHLGFKKCRQL